MLTQMSGGLRAIDICVLFCTDTSATRKARRTTLSESWKPGKGMLSLILVQRFFGLSAMLLLLLSAGLPFLALPFPLFSCNMLRKGWESGALGLTAMSKSPSCRSTRFRGSVLWTEPSTRTMSPMRTGEKMPGMEIEARMARLSRPVLKTYSLPPTRSDAEQQNGIGRSSMCTLPVMSSRRALSFWPVAMWSRPNETSMSESTCLRLTANTVSLSSLSFPAA